MSNASDSNAHAAPVAAPASGDRSADKQDIASQTPAQEAISLGAERQNRAAKRQKLLEAGVALHPGRFERSHQLSDLRSLTLGTEVTLAGRLMRFREMGKITFAHLQDWSGQGQVIFQRDRLGDDYKIITKLLDLGDFIGVKGEVYQTKTGEMSCLVKEWKFLGKALLPLPEKWKGLRDGEAAHRQRYLDLISNPSTRERFKLRSDFIRALREFYWQENFLEVETPTLMHKATGANARPYRTHNHALDIDVVLRISHELPLKELIVGGFEKIFEIGKAFRNEGHDPSHLPEHTHIEHYCAYWNFEDNILFTERMFASIFAKLGLSTTRTIKDRAGVEHQIDFQGPWRREEYVSLLSRDSGLDIMSYQDADTLRNDLRTRGIEFDGMQTMGLSTLIDNLYKKVSRPKIVQPTILYRYPKALQPLARVNDEDSRMVDQFQMVVNGWELVKAYSELVDPIDQRQRFEEQARAKSAGDEEAMEMDEHFLTAMEHGMPPISGWGMGLDRTIALLTGCDNVRDVVLFPLLRPE
jgi:lysyl-tRNA synthetase class 2